MVIFTTTAIIALVIFAAIVLGIWTLPGWWPLAVGFTLFVLAVIVGWEFGKRKIKELLR